MNWEVDVRGVVTSVLSIRCIVSESEMEFACGISDSV